MKPWRECGISTPCSGRVLFFSRLFLAVDAAGGGPYQIYLDHFVVVVHVVKLCFFFVETINHLFGFNVPSFVVVFMIWDDFFTINMNVMKVIYKVIVFAPHDSCLISDFRGFSYVSF